MAKLIEVHPRDPQPRRVRKLVDAIREGGLVAYPTDSSYALGCHIGDRKATDRIHQIRKTDRRHNFTLVCRDLSEISNYARVDNWAYRLIKSMTPGAYTFILPATRGVPKRLQNPKRRTIGLRVPDHPLVHAMLEELGEPIMSSTLTLPAADGSGRDRGAYRPQGRRDHRRRPSRHRADERAGPDQRHRRGPPGGARGRERTALVLR